jgi:signal transduction histidine kinase
MNNFQKKIQELGEVEDFEVKNNSLLLFLIGPSLFIFSYFINNFGDDNLRIKGAREFFALLFLIVSILPHIFKKRIKPFFGWMVFLLMLSFTHYLIINLAINNFSVQFLLGFYVFVFGSILLFNNRTFISAFLITIFIHLLQKLTIADIDVLLYKAVLSSFTLLFMFSFISLIGSTIFRKKIRRINRILYEKTKEKTIDLAKKAKDLEGKNLDLEEFAFVVSHDLKTPLSNILALSSWLKESVENKDGDAIKTNAELIDKQVTQMDLIIRGVLNYSLQNDVSSNYEEINLDILVNDLAVLFTNKNCMITVKSKLPIIEINKTKILQVFQNLIQNGIKYNNKELFEIEIDYKLEQNLHTFSVKDNGIGIEKKYHKKIFELFQRLDVNGMENAGIGLSLVKKIISRNNGEIYLESEVNVGSTFYFTLPA